MSNLGLYQWMPTAAKKVGGPINFIALIATGGAVLYKGCEIAIKKIFKKLKENKYKSTYKIIKEVESNEGIIFSLNDEFEVLGICDDIILIAKVDDIENVYSFDRSKLIEISNFA